MQDCMANILAIQEKKKSFNLLRKKFAISLNPGKNSFFVLV